MLFTAAKKELPPQHFLNPPLVYVTKSYPYQMAFGGECTVIRNHNFCGVEVGNRKPEEDYLDYQEFTLKNNTNDIGLIVGISVACVLVAAVIIFVIVFIVIKKKKKDSDTKSDDAADTNKIEMAETP